MFHLGVMDKNVANIHKSVVTTSKVQGLKFTPSSMDCVIFAVSMKTIEVISLTIWNKAIWMTG